MNGSFEDFYAAMFPFAYKASYAYLYDKSVVEDVLQDVFLVAFRKFDTQVRQHPNPKGWLVTTIKYTANKYVAREIPNERVDTYIDDYGLLEVIPFDFPKEEAGLLLDYYQKCYSISSIAAQQGQSANHVRVKLFRARAKLKAHLKRFEEGKGKVGAVGG